MAIAIIRGIGNVCEASRLQRLPWLIFYVRNPVECLTDEERSVKPIMIQFCAVSIGDRHGWVSYCSRVCNRLPDISSEESDDVGGLDTLPQDIKQQLMKSSDPKKITRPVTGTIDAAVI